MRTKSLGVRELKSKLSSCLREVRRGRTILITDRGRPVGQITPVTQSLEERLRELAKSGHYRWSGKRLRAGTPPKVKPRGRKLLSDIVLENRD